MLPDRVSNPGPLTYVSGALPIALSGLAINKKEYISWVYGVDRKTRHTGLLFGKPRDTDQ